MFGNEKIYDAHVHVHPYWDDLDEIVQISLDYLSFTGLAGMNFLFLRERINAPGDDSAFLYLKALCPEKISLFSGMAIGFDSIPDDADALAQQVRDLIEAGFDGFKMISTGSTRALWGNEIDEERFEPMFKVLEETRFPVTWHVGNTEHWPARHGPGTEKLKDIVYKPGNEPNNEPLYERLEHVLERHPNLNLMIPHWIFMAEHRERVEDFMVRHPNVTLDITPGSGMLYYMSQNRDKWHEFVVKYQDRLIFGTDNFIERMSGAVDLQTTVRRFMETDDRFFVPFVPSHSWGFELTGIGPFDELIMQKIWRENFDRIRGGIHPLKLEKTIAYLEKELLQLEQSRDERIPERNRILTREVIRRLKAML